MNHPRRLLARRIRLFRSTERTSQPPARFKGRRERISTLSSSLLLLLLCCCCTPVTRARWCFLETRSICYLLTTSNASADAKYRGSLVPNSRAWGSSLSISSNGKGGSSTRAPERRMDSRRGSVHSRQDSSSHLICIGAYIHKALFIYIGVGKARGTAG